MAAFSLKKISPLVRAIAVIGAIMTLATGATFAAMQDSVTLTGNTLAAADANLQIWNGTEYADTAEGFDVTDLVPDEWTTENFFYLKNVGGTDLNITAQSSEPAVPTDGYGFSGWENLKVKFTSDEPDCAPVDAVVETNMAALIAGDVELPCNDLSEGAQGNNGAPAEGNYGVSYKIIGTAVTGDEVGVGDFTLTFTGAVSSSPETE